MKITFEINEIDYGAFVRLLLPKLKDKLIHSEGTMAKLLAKIAKMSPEAAGKLVDAMPQKTKNDLTVYLINHKMDVFVPVVEEYAKEKGLPFKVDGMWAQR